jgi:plastocyanin
VLSPNRPRARHLLLVGGAVALLLGACGDDGATASGTTSGDGSSTTEGTAGCKVVEERTVTLVAKDLAWDTACIQAPEGVPFTIEVDNQDSGVNHDLHLKDAPGGPATKLEAGPVHQTLEVDGLDAGNYQFTCDVHPNMTGRLEVLGPLSEGPTTTTQP